jgi:hypothetical protein
MTYSVKVDEIAFLLKPVGFDKHNNWTGEVATAIAMHEENTIKKEEMSHLVDLVTMLGAFIDVMQYDDYVFETVEHRRNEMIDLEMKNRPPIYEEVEGTEGKVIRLTAFTKTEGNA